MTSDRKGHVLEEIGQTCWAMDMAHLFPAADVVGLDIKEAPLDQLSSAGAGTDVRPPNYRFVAGNILEQLPFPDASFDFVHQRLLFFAIPANRWDHVLAELCRVTRLGDWIELAEGHFGYEPMGQVTGWLVEAAFNALQKRGIDPRSGPALGNYLKQAQLAQVDRQTVNLPVGNWGGRIGSLVATDLAAAHTSARPLVLSEGVSEAEWAELFERMHQEWEQLHSTWPFYIAYGQRVA